jgi:two-component system OmpR family response regulator
MVTLSTLPARNADLRETPMTEAAPSQPTPVVPAHVVIVDDDPGLRALIGDFLDAQGYRTSRAQNPAEMRAILQRDAADCIILDLMMPGEDGLSALRSLPPAANRPAIIMLSVMAADVDRIVGLELGADDYVAKPCNPRELLARVRAVLRRREAATAAPAAATDNGSTLRFAGWALDTDGYALTAPDGTPVALTTGEMRLLGVLARNARRLVSRDRLIEEIHGHDADQFDRAVDVAVSRLRRKLAPHDGEALIRTVRGEGYMLAAPLDGAGGNGGVGG